MTSWPETGQAGPLPKITLMTMTEWRKGPPWDTAFSHAYSEMLNVLTFRFFGAFWSWRHPLSMGLPTDTDWLLSDSKDHPSQKQAPVRVPAGKASFLTEKSQYLFASNVQTQSWFTNIMEKHTKLSILTAICVWHFPRLPRVSVMPSVISQLPELLHEQWLNGRLNSVK